MFDYINLQLFAVLSNGTNATVASGSMGAGPANAELSVENKTYYDMTLIDEAQAQLVHDQFGQKKPIPAGGGKTIEFRKFHSYEKALTPLQEGVTPAGKAVKVTAITSTVDQYGDYTMLSDVLDLTSIDNVVLETTKNHGRQAGMTLDTVTRNVLHSGTNVTYCPSISAKDTEITSRANLKADCQLTVDVIMQVVAKLRAMNAPTINGKYVAIIHPYVAYDLMTDPLWVDAHKYTNATNLYEGEIGEIAGVRFVQTSEARIYKGEGCPTDLAVFGTLFLADGAYGVTEITGGGLETIVKQKGSAGTADPLNQRSTVGWKAIKTAEILIQDYIVRVESCSAKFSGTASAN